VTYPDYYYDDIRGRIQAILLKVGPALPKSTYAFVAEELDSNELGIALETIVDVLAEIQVPVSGQVVQDLADLADTMEIDHDIAALLGPFTAETGL